MPNPLAEDDPLLVKLNATIHGLLATNRRYPIIEATARELDRLIDPMQRALDRRSGPTQSISKRPRVPILNDAVLQLVRDAFDMLVIDLASLREGFVEANGFLNELKSRPEVIHQCSAAEFPARSALMIGDHDDSVATFIGGYANLKAAENVNAAILRLFGNTFPVTREAVEALIRRFLKATEPIDKDRNHVRAHRYEHRPFNRSAYSQPLAAIPAHLAVFSEYVGDLYLVLTRNSFHLKGSFKASLGRTAEDLADLMVHGSINSASNFYDAPPTPQNRTSYYYARRERTILRLWRGHLASTLSRVMEKLAGASALPSASAGLPKK